MNDHEHATLSNRKVLNLIDQFLNGGKLLGRRCVGDLREPRQYLACVFWMPGACANEAQLSNPGTCRGLGSQKFAGEWPRRRWGDPPTRPAVEDLHQKVRVLLLPKGK